MRVALALPVFLPVRAYGGPVTNAAELGRGLRDAGDAVQVLTSTLGGPGRPRLERTRETLDGLDVRRMPVIVAYRWSPIVRWCAPDPAPDVLHVFGAWDGFSLSAIRWARREGIPWLWEPSGMLVERGRKRTLKRLLRPLHRALARSAAGVIWTSARERAEAPADVAGVRGWLRPNPVPGAGRPEALPSRTEARRALGLPERGPLWGYLGRIARRKGIECLLDAWAAGPGRGTLCLAGPVEDAEVAARISRAGRSVRLLPQLSQRERWSFLRALDAVALTPEHGENFGMAALEAVSVGTPVVASPAVGVAEWLRDCGVRVVDTRNGELSRLLAADAPPSQACRVPEVLEPERVCTSQRDIYREAIGPRAGAHPDPA